LALGSPIQGQVAETSMQHQMAELVNTDYNSTAQTLAFNLNQSE
jgi:hypothetical protein